MKLFGVIAVLLGVVAGCAHVPRCGTAIGWVQADICVDPQLAECLLPFAPPIPPSGCEMTVDPDGPAERSVICVASCEHLPWVQ